MDARHKTQKRAGLMYYSSSDLIRLRRMPRTQRIRDPIHDLIVFEDSNEQDQIAWQLIQTPEFQRLRRIKQLGVSEFVYPGATHSRFAHCVGAFHNARRLIFLIEREIRSGRAGAQSDPKRANIARLAALLHDIGHGPFSHAFEEARKSIAEMRAKSGTKPRFNKHEIWTGSIVENTEGNIAPILESQVGEGTAKAISALLVSETPTDMYHAVVSSSFGADRLDYIQRDRYMTGTGVGAIDLRWLLDNVRVSPIDVSAPGEDATATVTGCTFCLDHKGREAAEDFLLARFRLYSNVYLHKTTRGIEQLLTALFKGVAIAAENNESEKLCLSATDPLVRFFAPDGETVQNYLALDDGNVWGAIKRIASGADDRLAAIAHRVLERNKPFALDFQSLAFENSEHERRAEKLLDNLFAREMGLTVFKDEASLALYGEIGADDEKAHKRLMILLPTNDVSEITSVRNSILRSSDYKRRLLRYYFLDKTQRDEARIKVEAATRGRH